MQDLLARAQRQEDANLNASNLFKAMLSAVWPEVVEPTWQSLENGESNFVAADGTILATLSRVDGRWTVAGQLMTAAQYRAMAKGVGDMMK